MMVKYILFLTHLISNMYTSEEKCPKCPKLKPQKISSEAFKKISIINFKIEESIINQPIPKPKSKSEGCPPTKESFLAFLDKKANSKIQQKSNKL